MKAKVGETGHLQTYGTPVGLYPPVASFHWTGTYRQSDHFGGNFVPYKTLADVCDVSLEHVTVPDPHVRAPDNVQPLVAPMCLS